MARTVIESMIVFLAIVLVASGHGRAQEPRPNVIVLPLPSSDLSPADQDLILANLAVQLRTQFRVKVLSGRAVGRAVWGTLGSGLEEAGEQFRNMLNRGKRAYKKLQMKKALRMFEGIEKPLSRCGPEIKDPKLFENMLLYRGLSLLAVKKKAEAEKQFMQAVSMNTNLKLSSRKYPPDVISAFEAARKKLLSARPSNLNILSKPAGAAVYIDGQRRGVTPLQLPLYRGYHFIRLEKEGYSPWTLTLPAGVSLQAIRALLVKVWSGDPPEDLLSSAISRDDLNEATKAKLRLMAGYYETDGIVLVSVAREGSQVHLGMRLFVVNPEIVTRARLFNLGDKSDLFPKKIKGIVSTLTPLKQARARQRTVRKPQRVAVAPVAQPIAAPVNNARPAAIVPRLDQKTPVPIDEQTGEDIYGTPWYKTWWFWTITGVVVAGAAAGVTAWYLTREEGSWTLVVQPNH